ncbi:hypothetical protein EVC27_047 [Rhizobium phage RHph_I1_6]|uniref:DUF3307 domain-containing protein n=1 Tax=Rhizobium phage RHph_I1_6 TaxID=2509728 RepID=A0A7S5RFI5_9CAUD|nr:membrane protein [Rhizobium phage RHph_I1_6]QIG76572.1 hypothetical protein EVC27_047 [Rhizobium phage RHph_I1_6]
MTYLGYDWIGAFLILASLHFLFDYPLQGDFLANQKNPNFTPRYVPWYHANFAHAAIHGIPVGIITGSYTLALSEIVVHFCIDLWKSLGLINIHVDQLFHIICKAIWVFYAYYAFTYGRVLW